MTTPCSPPAVDRTPRAVYVDLIAAHDGTLSKLREQWLEAAPARKAAWMLAIDAGLDQRLRLMELRDAVPA